MPRSSRSPDAPAAPVRNYRHAQDTAARPDAGAAPRFRGKRETATYRYDSSLAPALDWDTAPARDTAAWLLAAIEDAAALPEQTFPEVRELRGADGSVLLRIAGLQDALAALKRMQAPFLNWTGKAERLSFEVPTLPLFVHERLSTEAIVKTLEDHRKRPDPEAQADMFGDPRMPMAAQVNAYAHRSGWVNRMILGDSLSVMNSLARFEGLAGQVQCIYMDPPYGVKFGSNFQPFVRKRGDPANNDDADMTREPEMVQAYRDTWELGLHSYLTYLRDRVRAAYELLAPKGSFFLQIGDDNLHYAKQVLSEIFGAENFVVTVLVKKKGSQRGSLIDPVNDYLLWFAKDKERIRFKAQFTQVEPEDLIQEGFSMVELPSGEEVSVGDLGERSGKGRIWYNDFDRLQADFPGAKLFASNPLTSGGVRRNQSVVYSYQGREYDPGIARGSCWKHTARTDDGSPCGLDRLASAGRLYAGRNQLRFKRYASDFGFKTISNWWDGFGGPKDPIYVVQTNAALVQRCLLMATEPGDLVLDPTCGSGTTAYVAEQWGRRWITIDTSRVPLALARQRLLTATFPWHRLKDDKTGPSQGFVYARRQNRKGEEVGGIVPHITSSTIANNEPPTEEVLVDRPETDDGITRVSGPFVVEAVLPTPLAPPPSPQEAAEGENVPPPTPATPPLPPGEGGVRAGGTLDTPADHIARMIEVLRRSPTLALPGGGKVTLKSIRRPARTLNLSAEAMAGPDDARPVAILFGPADGSVTARAVLDAAKEANIKNYAHLYVIGFGFTAEAQAEIDGGEAALGLPVSRVTMTMDVLMGDLLKTQRSSQIFAITGSPEIAVTQLPDKAEDGAPRWQVRLLGLDTFDPATMQAHHINGDDVPMWMLDTAWNGMAFTADQVFFPRTSAWDNLRRALRSTHDDSVWDHLRGDTSAPFAADAGTEIAVKVLDERGNELIRIARLGA